MMMVIITALTELKNSSVLSQNLAVIFLLKNILQVGDIQLEKYLKEIGDPMNWINLCEQCIKLTRNALELHRQIIKADRELCNIQQTIVNKVKQTVHQQLRVTKRVSNRKLVVWERTRNFVKNSNLGGGVSQPVNPFIDGDKLAFEIEQRQQLANGRIPSPSSPKVKIEVNEDVSENDDEGDIEWEVSEDDFDQEDDSKSKDDKLKERKRFPKLPASIKHVVINGKTKCNFCDEDFFNRTACYNHEKEKHPDKSSGDFICDICGKIFERPHTMRQHKQLVHKIIIYKDKVFTSYQKLKEDPKSLICKLCLKKFATQKILQAHVRTIHEKRLRYRCDVCGLRYASTTKRKVHILQVHKDEPITKKLEEEGTRFWKCEIGGCYGKFLEEGRLDTHYKNTHGLERSEVEKDIETFRNLKRFSCEICGKSFLKKYVLRKHIARHTS